MAFLDPVLNPVLLPILNTSPFLGIAVIAFVISVLITLVYKYSTNQDEMKRLKEKQKEFQARMKELRNTPDEAMKVQKEAMQTNMQYMKHSFKATLITMLPIILIFGWMNAHLAYEPIYPGETYSITAMFKEGVMGDVTLMVEEGTEIINDATQEINSDAEWSLKSDAGEHFLTLKVGEEEKTKKVLITTDLMYEEALTQFDHSDIETVQINYNKLRPLGDFSFFGWEPGWLGLYIVFSIIFSIVLRKGMKVY